MTWLHWTLMFVGGLVAYGVVAYPLCLFMCRRFRSMTTTDPDTCRDKALEFAGDAYRDRSDG